MSYTKRRLEMGEVVWQEYQKQRKNNKAKAYKKRQGKVYSLRAAESRRNRKRKLIIYKGGKCEMCGYDKDIPGCYEFHHTDPSVKEYGIGSKNYSFERLKEEADKCILVCRNCHAEVHHYMKDC